MYMIFVFFFFFSSRRRHTRLQGDWSSDVCSSDLPGQGIDLIYGVAGEACEKGYGLAKIEKWHDEVNRCLPALSHGRHDRVRSAVGRVVIRLFRDDFHA